jgi:phenylalanyl-tRNA synthetase beta subunit
MLTAAIDLLSGSVTIPVISPTPAWAQTNAQQQKQKTIAKMQLAANFIHISLANNLIALSIHISAGKVNFSQNTSFSWN